MSDYDNTNRGSIWPNDKKETDKHPDFTGSLNVDGVDYWVSAWKRKPDANPKAPSLSFSVKRKDAKRDVDGYPKSSAQKNPTYGHDDFDDPIPF